MTDEAPPAKNLNGESPRERPVEDGLVGGEDGGGGLQDVVPEAQRGQGRRLRAAVGRGRLAAAAAVGLATDVR